MPWDPQPGPQTSAMLADWCQELFLAGGRFAGKSRFQLGYQEDAALRYAGKSAGIMIRKTYGELEELQNGAREIFSASGAIYKVQPSTGYPYTNCWYWPNGATCKMRYLEHPRDYGRLHGHEYSHISIDEACEYAQPDGIYKVMSTLRNRYGVPCSVRFTGNPGGAGHHFFKSRYIDFAPPYVPRRDTESGIERMWIPATMRDNPIGMLANPGYESIIRAAAGGNMALMQAWLNNDWNITAGAFFSEFSYEKHVIKPFKMPPHWVRLCGYDKGSASPFAVIWAAISDGTYPEIPRGAMVIYREWYGAREALSGQWAGLKISAEEIAIGIREREIGEKIDVRVADPSIFAEDGGPSHGERMGNRKVHFLRGDNTRVSGWEMVRARLQWRDYNTPDERFPPMIYFFDNCRHMIRTLPVLQHDEHRIEDVETTGEDHLADALRYLCMSRPWTREIVAPKPLRIEADKVTFNDLLRRSKQLRKASS